MRNKPDFFCVSTCIAACAFFFIAASSVDAQTVRRPAAKEEKAEDVLRIRKITGLGTRGEVRTPEYRTSARRGMNRPGTWARVMVEYETEPEWIDELIFSYYVLTLTEVDGKKSYSFFRNNVRYIDIKEGRRHYSAVFLRPNTIERYGEPVAIAVEISYKGEIAGTATDVEKSAGLPAGEWWKNRRVIDNDLVTERNGYLLNRAESPFALINIDDYEAIR